MLDKVVYTVLTGDHVKYNLREVSNPKKDWTYICYTNIVGLKSDTWRIRQIGDYGLDNKKLSRLPKILYFKFFPNCSMCLYIDSKFTGIHTDIDDMVKVLGNNDVLLMKHPKRKCLYDEAKKLGIQNSEQILKYKKQGVPKKIGLFAPGIMLRKNTDNVRAFMSLWWIEVMIGSHRDQPSLMYIYHKFNKILYRHSPVKFKTIPFKETCHSFMGKQK